MSKEEDLRVGRLLEQMCRLPTFDEACSVLLANVLAHTPADRGAVVVRRQEGEWEQRSMPPVGAGGLELPHPWGPLFERAFRAAEPTVVSPSSEDGAPRTVLPFRDAGGRPLGAVVLEQGELTEEVERLASVVGRCGSCLGRVRSRDRLKVEREALERENAFLTRIQDALMDPVVLTDPGNNIMLANQRAHELFSSRDGDTIGRSRAVSTNAFLFSVFLTQEQIGADREAGRELNLVDPFDGSDLFFEVLTTHLPTGEGEERLLISVLRDITDLKRVVNELELEYKRSRAAEHRARQESQRLNTIIENAAQPILVTDGQSRIVLMNAEAERLFELPGERGGGVRRHQVWTNVTRFTSLVNEFLLRPDTRRKERVNLTDPRTGQELPVEAVTTKILDRLDEPVAVVTVLRDLRQELENERLADELRELNEGLEEKIETATRELADRNRLLVWQRRELQKASKLKSEFLARMSHELRTPINAMIGYTSLLQERILGELTPEQEKALRKVEAASEHLLALISEILDLSRIEAGKMPVRLEEVHLGDLVSEISQTVGPLVDRKGLRFVVELTGELPPLRTDPTKLRQVLLNLLQNAVKFTPEGRVELRASPGEDGIRIQVEDTGIGIKPENLDVIFEDFRQADQSDSREYGGTGLGLSISKKLLTLIGGRISVESEYGAGTCFTIRLPLRPKPEQLAGHLAPGAVDDIEGEPERLEAGGGEGGPPDFSFHADASPG